MQTSTVNIRFYWVNMHGGDAFTGRVQSVKLPFAPLMEFVKQSAFKGQPQKWSALSSESQSAPRFVFRSRRNLHNVCEDKLVRRKLSKFLRDRFRWCDCTEIILADDFVPYSFMFREMRNGTAGICGGLILHGQDKLTGIMEAAMARLQAPSDKKNNKLAPVTSNIGIEGKTKKQPVFVPPDVNTQIYSLFLTISQKRHLCVLL